MKLLVYGFGNTGRRDDAAGPMCADRLESWIAHRDDIKSFVTVESNYQLNVEDASTLADFDLAVFVDASRGFASGFKLSRVLPSEHSGFSTHAISPSQVAGLCKTLYKPPPPTFLMEIGGVSWDVGDGMSAAASLNVSNALDFLKSFLEDVARHLGASSHPAASYAEQILQSQCTVQQEKR